MKGLLIFLCLLMVFACSTTLWSLDPKDPALVGLWLCDDGKGDVLTDSSGNKNDGAIGAGFKWDKGKIDGCIVASGGGNIDVKTSDSVSSIKKAITVAGWFRVDADSDTGIRRQNAFLLEDQSSTEPVPDGWSFRLWTTAGLSPGIYSTVKINKEEWTHIAGTYDGKNMRIYFNGVEDKELRTAGNAKTNGEWSGDIGSPGDILQLKYGSESYSGGMDELILFNRALSEEEIKQLAKGWKNALSVESKGKLAVTWGSMKLAQ